MKLSRHNFLSLAALSIFNRWWIGELLNALLRPVWLGARSAEQGAGSNGRYARRFFGLLNACPCYPYLVIADDCGLWILEGEAADEARDRMDDEDSFAAERDACPALLT